MDALKLKNKMREEGLSPSSITYSTLIHGLDKEGKSKQSVELLNEMMKAGKESSVMDPLVARVYVKWRDKLSELAP